MRTPFHNLSVHCDEEDLVEIVSWIVSSSPEDMALLRNMAVLSKEELESANKDTGRIISPRRMILVRRNADRDVILRQLFAACMDLGLDVSASSKALGPDLSFGAIFDDMEARGSPYECFGPVRIGAYREDFHFLNGSVVPHVIGIMAHGIAGN